MRKSVLEEALEKVDLIEDGDRRCEEENHAVYSYIEEAGLMDVSEEDWDMLHDRGLCCEDIAEYHLEANGMDEEERGSFAQILQEMEGIPLDEEGRLTKRLHWWGKNVTPAYVRNSMRHLEKVAEGVFRRGGMESSIWNAWP